MRYLKNFIIVLVIIVSIVCSKPANPTLSITLYNSDGSVPSAPKMELFDISDNENKIIPVVLNNQFELDSLNYGLYFVTLSNEKDESSFIPIFSDGKTDLTLKAYLPFGKDKISRRYKVFPRFVFSDTTLAAYKISEIYSKYVSDHSNYMDSSDFYKTKNINNGKYVDINRNEILSQLKENLKLENVKEVREMLYIDYLKKWSLIRPDPLDSAICANALLEIKPNSVFWSFGGHLLNYAIWSTKNKEKYNNYVEEVIKGTKNPNVKAELLYSKIMDLSQDNKYEEMLLLIDKLKKECPNTYKAKIVESEFLNTAVGKSIPDFSFSSLDNPKLVFTKSQMMGKIYLVDFWGTWCTPCVAEMETLHKVYEKYKTKGLEIISVAADDKENVIVFRKNKWAMPWMNTVLLKEKKSDELLKSFGVYAFPTAYLVSKDGLILARNEDLRGNNLETTLKKYIE